MQKRSTDTHATATGQTGNDMKARSQAEHARINAREYPGTRELCCECDEPTGRAGIGEDSLYTDEGEGPFCEECWELAGVIGADESTQRQWSEGIGPLVRVREYRHG